MQESSTYQRSILAGAVGFGLGFLANAFALWFFSLLQPGRRLAGLFSSVQIFDKLLVVLVIGLLTVGFGGALAGWIGATALGRELPHLATAKFRRRTAVAFGVTQAVVVVPFIFFTALVAFYDKTVAQTLSDVMLLGAIYGVVFGLIAGLLLGFLTVNWRRVWRILLGSIIGFGLGGAAAGVFLWLWLLAKAAWLPSILLFLLALASIGLLGGALLATAYRRVDAVSGGPSADKPRHLWLARVEEVVGIVVGLVVLFGIVNTVGMLQVREAPLNTVITLPTLGTAFTEPLRLSTAANGAGLFVTPDDGRPALAWSQDGDVFTARQTDDGWSPPVNVSASAAESANPQGAAGAGGQVNLVWDEGGQILFSRCDTAGCAAPVALPAAACAADNGRVPAIAAAPDGQLMVIWEADNGQLGYAVWDGAAAPESATTGCVGPGGNPRLAAAGSGVFQLVYDSEDEQVFTTQHAGDWQAPLAAGTGHSPEVAVDARGLAHVAWCDGDGRVAYRDPGGETTAVDYPPCQGRPVLAEDGQERLHLVWYADEARRNTGSIDAGRPFFYEAVLTPAGWSDPAVIAVLSAPAVPALAAGPDGVLHLAWSGDALTYAAQRPYSCNGIAPQTTAGRQVLTALQQPQFHPTDQPVPYCQNRYDALLYTPNPDPAFSEQVPRVNSAFDYMRDLVTTADYEVLFATMQWVPDENNDSPGYVIAEGVADLYQKVKDNPAAYPRGMTVRILVGNMPDFNVFKLLNQVWNILADLRAAGVTEMVNDEIGWRVQVANYAGRWPHSHAKLIVVDGETVLAKGINVSYLHYPIDNPSGLGLSMADFGILATGPLAQHGVATYDDLWNGAQEVVCDNMEPLWNALWVLTCDRVTAVADHTPETLRFRVPDEADDIVFSQYRSHVHFASDAAVVAALSTAEKSLDIFEVNFTLELICDVGVVFSGVCDFDEHALPFMRTLMQQVEANRIPVRILVEEKGMDGLENMVAIQAFVAELEKRGLSEYVDIHFYNGKMHAKGFLVDDAFLVVGSQNFQYSSWGDAALNEYNLSTENAEAIETFKKAFEFYWADSTPASEVMKRTYPTAAAP